MGRRLRLLSGPTSRADVAGGQWPGVGLGEAAQGPTGLRRVRAGALIPEGDLWALHIPFAGEYRRFRSGRGGSAAESREPPHYNLQAWFIPRSSR